MLDRLLFASTRGAPRVRRPLDVVYVVGALVLLFPLSQVGRPSGRSERTLAEIAQSWPDWVSNLAAVVTAAPMVVALLALVTALLLRRYAILLGALLAVAVVVALLLAGMLAAGYHFTVPAGADPAITWPPAVPTIAATVLLAVAVDLADLWRTVTLWVLGLGTIASVVAVETTLTGAIALLLVALAASGIARLAVGTSAGLLSLGDMRTLLLASGCDVADLHRVTRRADGVMVGTVFTEDGRTLQAKIRGRDAIEGRRVTRFWRSLAYNGEAATLGAGRAGVEGEALVTLLATERGAPVVPVVTVARPRKGVEVLTLRADGKPVAEAGGFDEADANASWAALGALHNAGIGHLNLQPSAIVRRADGSIVLTDLSEAQIGLDEIARATDRAQLVASQAALLGADRAVAVARGALTGDSISQLLPFLQPAAFPRELRRALAAADVDADDVRTALADAAGVPPPDLAPLRKLTWGAAIRTALLIFAASALLPMMLEIDWGEMRTAAAGASLAALVGAFLLGQCPRPLQAISTMGAVPARLPYVPVYVLQLGTAYLNIALPNAAARMALSIRFFKRQGVPPATALTSSLIESLFGNLIQAVLLIVIVASGAAQLSVGVDLSSPSGPSSRLVIVIVAVILLIAATVAFVPRVRSRVTQALREWWPQVRQSMQPLRNSRKLGQMLTGTIGAEIVFALTLLSFTEAFGGDLSLSEALVVNIGASLLATLLPVPGGIGISESALIVGLTSAGVDPETAFAAAIATRLGTFYLPPIWGWFALRWLTKRNYI